MFLTGLWRGGGCWDILETLQTLKSPGYGLGKKISSLQAEGERERESVRESVNL